MADKNNLTFTHRNEGFCRVYYRDERGELYCIQDDGGAGMRFYRCTEYGEPWYRAADPFDSIRAEYEARQAA